MKSQRQFKRKTGILPHQMVLIYLEICMQKEVKLKQQRKFLYILPYT